MASKHTGLKVVAAIVVVVIVGFAIYEVYPSFVSTKISDLKSGTTADVYGKVMGRLTFGSFGAFTLAQGNESVTVVWNGTMPAVGDNVLVRGTVNSPVSFVPTTDYIDASSVVVWYTPAGL